MKDTVAKGLAEKLAKETIKQGRLQADIKVLQAERDALKEALKNLQPEKTGYRESMDWNAYNRAVDAARALLAQLKDEAK